MNPGVSEELGKTTRSFFEIMGTNPLSLALIVSNFLLLGFLWYSNSVQLSQRKETVDLIVAWQREADKLMADCVSKDVMKIVIDALERDRAIYRQLLPQPHMLPQGESPKLQSYDPAESAPFVLPP